MTEVSWFFLHASISLLLYFPLYKQSVMQPSSSMYLFVVAVMLVITMSAAHDDSNVLKSGLGDDKGYVKNCGDAKHNFTAWWSPKVLVIGKEYTASVDFTPAIDWSSGTATAAVWLAKDPQQPIYKTSLPVDCSFLKKIPNLCPFHKGKRIQMMKSSIPFKLPYPLPAEKYKLKASVVDGKGQLLICAEVEVTLQDESDTFNLNYDMFKDGFL